MNVCRQGSYNLCSRVADLFGLILMSGSCFRRFNSTDVKCTFMRSPVTSSSHALNSSPLRRTMISVCFFFSASWSAVLLCLSVPVVWQFGCGMGTMICQLWDVRVYISMWIMRVPVGIDVKGGIINMIVCIGARTNCWQMLTLVYSIWMR